MGDALPSLAELFRRHGSDKDRNGYSSLYNALFEPMRALPVRLLEVGIGSMLPGPSSMKGYMPDTYRPGASLRAWRDFFPAGEVHGMDIQDDCMIVDEPRVVTHLCDSTSAAATRAWAEGQAAPFDVIVDDGSHWYDHQLSTLRHLFPLLRPGGFYVIEDIAVGSPLSQQPLLVADEVGADAGIFFAGVKNILCVIHKVPLKGDRENF